jgi:hypothetical protein
MASQEHLPSKGASKEKKRTYVLSSLFLFGLKTKKCTMHVRLVARLISVFFSLIVFLSEFPLSIIEKRPKTQLKKMPQDPVPRGGIVFLTQDPVPRSGWFLCAFLSPPYRLRETLINKEKKTTYLPTFFDIVLRFSGHIF